MLAWLRRLITGEPDDIGKALAASTDETRRLIHELSKTDHTEAPDEHTG